ncbi:MAG: hypothetical protein AAGA84_08115 [Pseudomonadota bacterium]
MRAIVLLSCCIAAAASAASSEELCTFDMTEPQCREAVKTSLRAAGMNIAETATGQAKMVEETKQLVLRDADALLDQFGSGLTSAVANGQLTNLEEFLPALNLFALDGDGNDAQSIVLELNNILNLPIDDNYKFSITLNQPTPFEALLGAIPEADRAIRRDEFEQQIDDFDDVTLSFKYSWVSQSLGRSDFAFKTEGGAANSQIIERVFDDAVDAVTRDDAFVSARQRVDAAQDNLIDILPESIDFGVDGNFESLTDLVQNSIDSGGRLCSAHLTQLAQSLSLDWSTEDATGYQYFCLAMAHAVDRGRLGGFPDAEVVDAPQILASDEYRVVREYMSATTDYMRASVENIVLLQKKLDSYKYFELPALANNQPQLNLSVDWRERSDLVGQDAFNAKLTYEHGFVNLNSLTAYIDNTCSLGGAASCVQAYLDDKTRQKQLKNSDRFSVSVEYSRKQAYSYLFDTSMMPFTMPSETSLMGSLSYGRYLNFRESRNGQTRLEVSASYEDVDGDSMRQDRWFATASLSQQITEGAGLSLSLVYSNKPEFLMDVGTEVTARLGLNYKLFKPD